MVTLSPEAIGILVAFLILVFTRLLDFFLPKGTVFKGWRSYARTMEKKRDEAVEQKDEE
jgi:hypothetical protein